MTSTAVIPEPPVGPDSGNTHSSAVAIFNPRHRTDTDRGNNLYLSRWVPIHQRHDDRAFNLARCPGFNGDGPTLGITIVGSIIGIGDMDSFRMPNPHPNWHGFWVVHDDVDRARIGIDV